jgi:hypothetical protein
VLQAPRQGEAERGRGRAPAPAPAPEAREVKVVVEEPPPAAVARLQAQRALPPLQVTTQAAPTPMTVASGGVDQPPPLANYQPVMQTPPPVRPAFSPLTNAPIRCSFCVHKIFLIDFFVRSSRLNIVR